MDISAAITLNNGVLMPRLGLGVWRAAAGREVRDAVAWALAAGYRHSDTARLYGNEHDVGEVVRASGLPRADVFITTKLRNQDHGYRQAKRALDASLDDLGLEYVDLYLIHWPVERLRLESWRALEEALEEGKARAIGVSNYLPRHLDELLAASLVTPAVNQVELSPFLYQRDLLDYCRPRGIAVEAYSPLTRGRRLNEPVLVAAAARHGKTAAQVLIRWALQHDLVVIPKSVSRERVHENAAVFDFTLSDADMAELDALDEGAHYAWDPTSVP